MRGSGAGTDGPGPLRPGEAHPRGWAAAVLAACVAWGALGVLTCSGCASGASEAYLQAMYEGKRAYNAGRYAEAAERYRQAARRATRVKDRDEARFLEARMYQRLGQPERATETYRQLVNDSPRGPRTVRVVFELAYLAIAHGNAEQGWSQLRAAVLRHPNHGSARKGLTLVVRHIAEREGEPAARAFLRENLSRFDGTEADQQAEYELARSFDRSGLLEQARDVYVATARAHPYPWGNLTDDALWRASKIEEKLGRHRQAIEHLEQMLAPAEQDISGGRYERPRFPYARMRIAELYRDRLGDLEAAGRAFQLVAERHPESVLADDALWQAALLARRLGADDRVCELTGELRESHPDSRYVRCLRELCRDEPAVAHGRPCPPYIMRMVRGEPEPDEEL